jgi:hypothetical protein
MTRWAIAIAGVIATLTGCAAPTNPSFPITTDQTHIAVQAMRDNRAKLSRPLVVIGGYMDPDISPLFLTDFFDGVTRDSKIISVSLCWCGNMEDCRQTIIDAVDRACPNSDPRWTTEVDVVGASLGGLAARYAAADSLDPHHARRLKIARLFSISSPHAGAKMAKLSPIPGFNRQLQQGSSFLEYLQTQDATAQYQLIPYVHLNDEIVGDRLAAPPGKTAYWLSNDSILPPHTAAIFDERILADISRRLRYEQPFTSPNTTPLPETSSAN